MGKIGLCRTHFILILRLHTRLSAWFQRRVRGRAARLLGALALNCSEAANPGLALPLPLGVLGSGASAGCGLGLCDYHSTQWHTQLRGRHATPC